MPTLNELSEALVRADEAGDVAAATELAAAIHSQLQPAAPPKPIEEQSATAGPIEALKGSAKRFVSSAVTGFQIPFNANEAAKEGIARQEAITERPAGSLEEVKKAYREKGLLPAAKEVISQIPGVIAEQAPLIGTMAAGARLGAVGGPWGMIAGSILSTIPTYLGSTSENRAQAQIARGEPVDINVPGALVSAASQASLDRLSIGLGGLGKLFGISAKQLGTEAAEKLAKESLATAIAKGTIKTELAEIPTEIAQQAIDRYYAGQSLTDDDALKQYGDIAYQTSLMGPLGGVAGVSQRSEARDTVKKAADLQNQTLARIDAERQRINQIALDAQNEAEIRIAADEATKLAQESLNALGNKAPEKSKIARSIANMQKDFEKAIIENDVNAQKKAIDDLTNVPTSLVSLATPSPVINDATFNEMKIGPTAIIRKNKELHGLNPTILEDNVKIRNTLNALYETKEADSPQAVAIKNYLDSIPQPKELQNETTDVSGSGEGVQISGQSMAGELAGGTEGLDGTGLGSTADNVRQPDGREEGLPAPLKTPKFKPAMGIMAALKQSGGVNMDHLFDLTGERSVNKSGATVGLFTKNGRGLDDAVQVAVDKGYLPSDVLNEVDGGVGALSDLLIDEIQGKKAVPLDQQADAELEAYLAREEQKQALREEAPKIEDAKGLAKELGGEAAQILQAPFGNPGYNYTNKDGVEVTFRPEGRIFELIPGDESTQVGSDVHLDFIGSKIKNQGLASKELDRIIKKADQNNLSLSIEVSKQDKEGLSNAQLKKWYERKGFIFPGGYDSEVGYRPKADEDISQYQQKTITITDSKIPSVENQINSDLRNRTFSEPDSFFGHYGNGDLLTGYHAVPSYATKFDDIYYYDGQTKPTKVENLKAEYDSATKKLELSRINLKDEDINKRLSEATAEEKGILEAPKQQLGKRNPIFDKVTNGKELFKAVMKIANTRSDKAIINMLEKVPNLETVKVITENTSTDPELQGASGYFDPNTNTIFIDPRVTDLAHVTLHEIAHAATDAEFDTHVKVEKNVHTAITPLGKKMVKLFDAFMAESLKKQEGFYGQKNIKEFFMESYTDPKLKNFLQNRAGVLGLKPAKGKVATLWSDFVNLIKSMFGIPEYAHSMLDEILLLSPELMKGPGAITTGKEVSQARVTPQGLTRPDGTPLKYVEDNEEGIIQKFKNVFNDDTNYWRKWMDQLGNKIVGGRYSVERKALDADLPAVDAFKEGKIRGDLINLQAYNSMSLAQAGLYLGRLILRKSGLVIAGDSSGPDKVKMLDITKNWNELLDRATTDLGSKELAYDMLVAGYYGPRYAELAEFNKTASADEKINIDEWTESDKKTAEEAYRRYGTELKRLQDMRNVQRKDLLDFMVDAGLYTREKADRFLKRAEYVALYRVPEEEIESFDRPTTKGAGLLGAGKEYRLVGSKRAAADPIDNYIANMSWMMQRGIKNNAAKHTADMMQQLGVGQWYDRPMTDVEKKAYHHITVHVDGLPKDFRVDDPNDMAAFSASPIISGAVWDLMKYPVSGLRHGITMMPQFVWNQAWEDPIRATFTSGNKAGFMNNIIKTWKSIANNQFRADRTPNAAMLNRYGIVGQKDVLDSADIINLYKGKDKKIWQKSLFFFERMAQGSDLGAREAIYENAIKELQAEGYDRETAEDLAAVRSHQYMPYQQMGMSRSLAYLRRMMPFVNPPIQGMARDIAAARGRISGISKAEGKKLLAFRLTKYLMFTAMYAAFMSGDDEYENQSEEQQDNNFFIGGLRMPVPQELRPLKVAAERGTRAWVLNAPKADIEDMDVAAAALRKTWELVAGFAPVPSAVRPLVENYTNFDIFSGLPVVSAGQQRKEPYLQYTEKTSELAKVVGAQLNYSPIKIDKLLKGYFGYLGQTLGQITNYFAGDRPAPTANDILFIGSMLENQRATGNRGDFYELYDKVVGAKASANALKQEGDIEAYRKYVQENRGYLGVAPRVNQLHTMLTRLRQQKEFILKSNRSPEEKRIAIDNIMAKENRMLDNIRQLHKRAIENNN